MMRLHLLLVAMLLVGASALTAQVTRNVPAGFPTIQAAINASANNDTVLVAPGVYFENLSIQGKTITLRGSAGAAATIVDGSAAGPVLSIGPFLDRALLIEGLTFRNGRGANATMMSQSAGGGGIDIRLSAPTILRCDIINNVGGNASSGAIAGAGGILIRGLGPNPLGPAIRNCNILGNIGGTATPNPTSGSMVAHGGAGGIELVESNVFVRACIIRNNQGGDSIGAPNFRGTSAGGIGIILPDGMPVIEDNEIHFNTGGDALAGATFGGAGGIGSGGAPFIHYCNIGDNQGGDALAMVAPGAANFPVAGSGGIDCEDATIESNFVRGNSGGTSGIDGILGGAGGIGVAGDATIVNNVIGNNQGGNDLGGPGIDGAGGIHVSAGDIVVLNTTLGGNTSGPLASGGLHVEVQASATVKNSILWGNNGGGQGPSAAQIDGLGVTTVTFSDVQGGFPGMGNIDQDPLFVNPALRDFHLGLGSPCVDAGMSGDPLSPPKDIDGDPRVIGVSVEMGADEFPFALLPGSLEDLELESVVNNYGDGSTEAKFVRSGNTLELRVFAPGSCFNPADMYVVASPFATGIMPPSTPGLTGFHLDPNNLIVLGPGPMPLYEGSFGCGKRFVFQIGQSFPGYSLWVQGFAIDPTAANGWFAVTEAHELRFD
jgi:hypothetical protein